MKWFWLSFSLNGKNQGCCNVQANTLKNAIAKVEKLKIIPKYDDMEVFVLPKPELIPNKLITPKLLKKEGFKDFKYSKDERLINVIKDGAK